MSQDMVSIRLFKENDLDKHWSEVPINSYLPVFVSKEHAEENITARIKNTYLKGDKTVLKVRWNYKENEEAGRFVERD